MKNIRLKTLFVTLLILLSYMGQAQNKAAATQKPNIVLVLTDQWRADASKLNGFELDTTPFLDSIAQQGTWFDKAYCAMPACVPSRTSMLTGRWPSATRVSSNMNGKDAFFTQDLFDVVKSQGYRTALIGKNHTYIKPNEDLDFFEDFNHLGSGKPQSEEEREFNKFLHGTNFYMSKEATPFPIRDQMPAKIVSSAQGFADKSTKDGVPFFMWVSIPEPHNPYQAPEPYYSMFPPETLPTLDTDGDDLYKKGNTYMVEREILRLGYGDFEEQIPRIRSNYYGMMRLIDDQLKEMVDHLEKTGELKNTIFIFVADHGDYVGEYGMIKKGAGVPEVLTRIPMIWYGPGIAKSNGAHEAHVSNTDIMPTICDMLGVELPDGVQGRSLWPLLQGKEYPHDEFESILVQQGYGNLRYVNFDNYSPYDDDGTLERNSQQADELNTWTQSGRLRELRKGDWKLVYDMQGHGNLYNLSKDPAGINDLFNDEQYVAKKAELLEDLIAWELRAQDPLPYPHPNPVRRYGIKKDPRNYWAPYKNKANENLEKLKDEKGLKKTGNKID